jgi:hypothetical protein
VHNKVSPLSVKVASLNVALSHEPRESISDAKCALKAPIQRSHTGQKVLSSTLKAENGLALHRVSHQSRFRFISLCTRATMSGTYRASRSIEIDFIP